MEQVKQLDFTLSFFDVGDVVVAKEDIYDGPSDVHPGGILAHQGEVLIIRRITPDAKHAIVVGRVEVEGNDFVVSQDEVIPYSKDIATELKKRRKETITYTSVN